MSARLDHAVGLLERSLVSTREVLGRVRPDDLAHPTPCAGWDLAALLGHLDDSLDAWLEASSGHLGLLPPVPAYADPTASLRARACTLLGAWAGAAERDLDSVALDAPGSDPPHALSADLLVSTAALEIAVHGWDVGRSLGDPVAGGALPESLAESLLPVARCTIGAGRAAGHFAPALPARPDDPPRAQLLRLLGRPA